MKPFLSNPIHCLPLLAASLLIASTAQAEPPVKVYILAGQSNMQGKGGIEGDGGNSLRSLVNGKDKKEFQSLVDDKGEWVVRDDVSIHYDLHPWKELRHGPLKPGYGSNGSQVGPELGFGQVMGDATEGQVLLIKVAWGGKSLAHDFAPPSIGKYTGYPAIDEVGYYYTRLVEVVNLVTADIQSFFPDYKGQGVEIAGFGWHQGWNDQYGDGNKENYERNMVAFIKDIRSAEHGLGVPNLPFVIATSGMIPADSPIVKGQIAMGDFKKYPDFEGNVAVVDTHKPYGPNKMEFKFDKDGQPTDKVGYHWNSNARSYLNIGRGIAAEMQKLKEPKLPSRLRAVGTSAGVQLIWQFGTETPKNVRLLRNGKEFGAKLSAKQTTHIDTTALPGTNDYELVIEMPNTPRQKLTASSTTYVYGVDAFRSVGGVTLTWKNKGKFGNYKISRNGKAIEANLAGDLTRYEDKSAPKEGLIAYAIEPATGNSKPFTKTINLGPIDPGGALVYEPFNYYPSDFKSPVSLLEMKGAVGTVGAYFSLAEKPNRPPTVITGGSTYGDLPVMGNRVRNNFGKGCAIKLDDSLKKAGLLKDGATMWMSYVYHFPREERHWGTVTLQSEDHQHGVGFRVSGRDMQSVVILDGEMKRVRIGPPTKDADKLMVGKFVWGKDGGNDRFYPMMPKEDLKKPAANIGAKRPYLREPLPFNIDQTKLNRLVLQDGTSCSCDEIRVGPTFESVIGQGK